MVVHHYSRVSESRQLGFNVVDGGEEVSFDECVDPYGPAVAVLYLTGCQVHGLVQELTST